MKKKNLPELFDELLLEAFESKYLNRWGIFFGVIRAEEESDGSYRDRILEYLDQLSQNA